MKNTLLSQFDFHHKLYNNVLEGFTDEESNLRLHGDSRLNHVKYLAGHMLNSLYGFGFLAGVRSEVKWHDLFAAMGQSEARDDISYPSIEEIRTEWNAIHEEIRNALGQLTGQELNEVPPEPMDKVFENSPIFDNTIAGFWAFLNHHQAYHIGQIGILRMGFGKEPMRYD